MQEGRGGTEGLLRLGKRKVTKARCGEGPWRGHVRRGAPDLARTARPKSRGHTHSVPPWWLRPGSGRAGTSGPHRGLQVPQPGCTGPPSTHPGTGSCRKEHLEACTSRGHTWREQRKGTVRTGHSQSKATRGYPTPPALGFTGSYSVPRIETKGAKCDSLFVPRVLFLLIKTESQKKLIKPCVRPHVPILEFKDSLSSPWGSGTCREGKGTCRWAVGEGSLSPAQAHLWPWQGPSAGWSQCRPSQPASQWHTGPGVALGWQMPRRQ